MVQRILEGFWNILKDFELIWKGFQRIKKIFAKDIKGFYNDFTRISKDKKDFNRFPFILTASNVF